MSRKRQIYVQKKSVFCPEKGRFLSRKSQFFVQKKADLCPQKVRFFSKKSLIFLKKKSDFCPKNQVFAQKITEITFFFSPKNQLKLQFFPIKNHRNHIFYIFFFDYELLKLHFFRSEITEIALFFRPKINKIAIFSDQKSHM